MPRACRPAARVRAAPRPSSSAALDEFGAPVRRQGRRARRGQGRDRHRRPRRGARARRRTICPPGAVLVEEFLAGPEVSLFFLSDGDHVLPLAPRRTTSACCDGDAGPNTGGMGAYSPLPVARRRLRSTRSSSTVALADPSAGAARARARRSSACSTAGLIARPSAASRVIEFNARFGDPETQVVLPRLRRRCPRCCSRRHPAPRRVPPLAFSDGRRRHRRARQRGLPGGPDHRPADRRAGCRGRRRPGVPSLHAATAPATTDCVATGGRVLSVVGPAPDLAAARARAYEARRPHPPRRRPATAPTSRSGA